jgi:creatinine amidohydrolase
VTLLHEHTTTTAGEAFDDEVEVALLPTGATEQHGPALPLGTDFLVAEALARSVDREDTVVLPTLPVGVSQHHRQFDGTLYIEPETFEYYVRDVVDAVASHGVRKVVAVNGHGGNEEALYRAARRTRDGGDAFLAPWNWFSELDGLDEELFDQDGIGHADALETSMVYAVAEELVREEALQRAEDGAGDSWGKSIHGAPVGFDTADFSDSGAVAEPTQGSREKGERLYRQALDELDALIDWLAHTEFELLLPEPHR